MGVPELVGGVLATPGNATEAGQGPWSKAGSVQTLHAYLSQKPSRLVWHWAPSAGRRGGQVGTECPSPAGRAAGTGGSLWQPFSGIPPTMPRARARVAGWGLSTRKPQWGSIVVVPTAGDTGTLTAPLKLDV